MARWRRLVAPGFPLHVTQRGHNRAPTFQDDRDFAQYLELLRDASMHTKCEIHAYALMTNHVHILITPADARGPSRLMQRVGSRFVRYWNERHRRSGTLWNGRFHSSIVDNDHYALACCRYIDLNPVRAGIVGAPQMFEWSSYRRLAQGIDDGMTRPHAAYAALGATAESREREYRLFCAQLTPTPRVDIIRRATRGGAAAGDPDFLKRLAGLLRHPTSRHPHGGDRRSVAWQDDNAGS